MSDQQNHEALVTHIQYIREGIDGINSRLDAQNGRIRTVELKTAILEDRQSEARKTGGAWGGVAGGFAGGFVAALMQYFGGAK